MSTDTLLRATPPGSLRYFAILYAAPTARPLLEALYAFDSEIEDTVVATHHDVAHTRLQWWRGEIDRLLDGQPQHPVTRALLPLRDMARELMPLLHERLVAADIDLARMTYASRGELDAYRHLAGGALQTLAAAACRQAVPTTSEAAFARGLGMAIVGVESLRDLRPRILAGRLPLPLDELEASGIAPESLLRGTSPSALTNLLEATRARLHDELAGLPALLASSERPVQRHGLVLAALQARLLDQIDHRGEVARSRVEVPHWSRLWTAWRTALRYA